MRRSKVTTLHPSQQVALGDVLSVRAPADDAGVRRMSEDQSIWDGLPNDPDVDINCYRLNFMFGDGFDVDTTDVWRETVVASGSGNQPLTARQWDDTGGHATIVAGDGAADLYLYQKQISGLVFNASAAKRVWFQTQFSYDVENTDQVAMIGFTTSGSTGVAFDDWRGMGFWYNPTEGQWYFSWKASLFWVISASLLEGTDWGPGVVVERYGHVPLGQLNSGMNAIEFNITWEDMGVPFYSSVPAIKWSINGGEISEKLLMVGLTWTQLMTLSFGVGNSGSGLNPALRLNYLQYMEEK